MRTILLFLLLGLTVLVNLTFAQEAPSKQKPRLAQWIITSNVSGTISLDSGREMNITADSSFTIWLSRGWHLLMFRAPGELVFNEKIRVRNRAKKAYRLDIKAKATEILKKEIEIPICSDSVKTAWHLIHNTVLAGANLNDTNSEGETALMLAVRENQINSVSFLLAQGADVNAATKHKITALMMADSPGIVKLLLEKGANLHTRSIWGDITLNTAAAFRSTEVVRLLIDYGADVNASDDSSRRTALIAAAGAGNVETVKLLLEKGADVNFRSRLGVNALMHAFELTHNQDLGLRKYHWEIVKLLLEKGAEVNASDMDQMLQKAARYGKVDVVKLLLQKGANVNTKNENGWTALSLAISSRHTEIVKLLIGKGANVNARDNWGKTPLMRAETEEIRQLLRSHGAKE